MEKDMGRLGSTTNVTEPIVSPTNSLLVLFLTTSKSIICVTTDFVATHYISKR